MNHPAPDRLVSGTALRRAEAWTGRVVGLWTAPAAGAPMTSVDDALALAGAGLDGDRYAAGVGSFSRWPGAGRAVTLIAEEDLRDAEAAFGVHLSVGEHRRNVVVAGVPVGDLRGVRFRVGDALLEGMRLCAPCAYLARVTGQADIFASLVGRGGLRAAVIDGGRVCVGDAVTPVAVVRDYALPG